jgi:hypothetical protein
LAISLRLTLVANDLNALLLQWLSELRSERGRGRLLLEVESLLGDAELLLTRNVFFWLEYFFFMFIEAFVVDDFSSFFGFNC